MTKTREGLVKSVFEAAEVLMITTSAGTTIGAHIGGPEGAKVGAITGLAVGVGILIYMKTHSSEPELAPYHAFLMGDGV